MVLIIIKSENCSYTGDLPSMNSVSLGIIIELMKLKCHLVLALLGGYVQRSVHVFGGGINIGAMLEQQHDDIDVTQTRSNVQRRLLFLSFH